MSLFLLYRMWNIMDTDLRSEAMKTWKDNMTTHSGLKIDRMKTPYLLENENIILTLNDAAWIHN